MTTSSRLGMKDGGLSFRYLFSASSPSQRMFLPDLQGTWNQSPRTRQLDGNKKETFHPLSLSIVYSVLPNFHLGIMSNSNLSKLTQTLAFSWKFNLRLRCVSVRQVSMQYVQNKTERLQFINFIHTNTNQMDQSLEI